ncbi:MAG: hypothetical protein AABX91_00800 [Nanoarchaeota archaeon]
MLDLIERFKPSRDLKDRTETDFEKCICCGRLTDVRKDTPVDARTCYVDGAGQLSRECYEEIYGPSPARKIMDGSS